MSDRPSTSLLMTATITPPPGVVTARADPAVRLEDYRKALAFNLGLLGAGVDRIVFVDNSASDLGPLRRAAESAGHADRCEFIGFHGLDYPPDYGYGYGEFRLLDHAMGHSRTIAGAGEGSRVVKVTGRYLVRNLLRLLRKLPREFDLACDIRNARRPWLDMRVMAWSPGGYETFLRGAYRDLRTDLHKVPPEMVLGRRLMGDPGGPGLIRRFPIEPFVDGIRGLDGANWTSSNRLVKHYLRAGLRRMLPWYPV
jgi:hypothetical protein